MTFRYCEIVDLHKRGFTFDFDDSGSIYYVFHYDNPQFVVASQSWNHLVRRRDTIMFNTACGFPSPPFRPGYGWLDIYWTGNRGTNRLGRAAYVLQRWCSTQKEAADVENQEPLPSLIRPQVHQPALSFERGWILAAGCTELASLMEINRFSSFASSVSSPPGGSL
jgi:hypothetical protein